MNTLNRDAKKIVIVSHWNQTLVNRVNLIKTFKYAGRNHKIFMEKDKIL